MHYLRHRHNKNSFFLCQMQSSDLFPGVVDLFAAWHCDFVLGWGCEKSKKGRKRNVSGLRCPSFLLFPLCRLQSAFHNSFPRYYKALHAVIFVLVLYEGWFTHENAHPTSQPTVLRALLLYMLIRCSIPFPESWYIILVAETTSSFAQLLFRMRHAKSQETCLGNGKSNLYWCYQPWCILLINILWKF